MSKNVAKWLVEQLEKVDIKHLYAITGDSLNSVNNAIKESEKVRWIHVRHEESGAFAAEAEAELNGIGCCAGSSGPGHVHLINGLYDANHNHASVLAIASTCPSREFGGNYFQETHTSKLFEDCSIYNEVASTPLQADRMFTAAIRNAICKKGVAVVALPGDVAAMEAVGSNVKLPDHTHHCCKPSNGELLSLISMLKSSKRIAIYCGVGAIDAKGEVLELARRLQAPIAYTYRAKMCFEADNPYRVGMTGLLGVPSAYIAMHEADMLIMIGTDFPFSNFLPNKCRIAQIDIRGEQIGRRANVELPLVGDSKCTLTTLLPMIEERTDKTFLEYCQRIHTKVKEDLADIASQKGSAANIAPEYLTSLIDCYASSSAIFTVDTGMCCTWSAKYLSATKDRRLLASFNHGSMCNALPMAIGAALARPKQQIVALCGDGGLSMMLGELATVVQYDLPIKIIVFNNRALGMVKLEMEVEGLVDWQTDLFNPDFSTVATAMGIKSFRVTDPDKLESVVKEALEMQGAVLVDVHTDPNAMAKPPKITAEQVKGFSTSMVKMLSGGDFDKVIDIIKAMGHRV